MKTNIQVINNIQGMPEYVLLPVSMYEKLKGTLEKESRKTSKQGDYIDFNSTDFIKNPIALARMKAKITQKALAEKMHTSQAYISKIENGDYQVNEKLFKRVSGVLQKSLPKTIFRS